MKKRNVYIPVTTTIPKKAQKVMPMYDDMTNNMVIDYTKVEIGTEERKRLMFQKKEQLAELFKLLFVMLTVMPTYADSLKEIYNEMVKYGLDPQKLGHMNGALQDMFKAEDNYRNAYSHVVKMLDFTTHREEILGFMQHSYNTITDLIEHSAKVDFKGNKIPEDKVKTLLIVEPEAAERVKGIYEKILKKEKKELTFQI